LIERYYDAHLCVANWGTHRVMLRLRCGLLDPDVVEEYCVDEQLSARSRTSSSCSTSPARTMPVSLTSTTTPKALLSAIVGVRAKLAAGDLPPLMSPG
jgi:hypothetical protein